MKIVGKREVQEQIDTLLDRVQSGEEVIIERDGEQIAKLVALPSGRPKPGKIDRSRLFGSLKGRIWMAPDWDAPMTEEELAEWYGKADEPGTSSTPTS